LSKKKNVQEESLILNKNKYFPVAKEGGKCEIGVFYKQLSAAL
jgi:hypothetical protein